MAQDKINQAANKDTDQDVPPHPCAPLIKLFSAGSFYFAPGSDLTRSVHARTSIPQGMHFIPSARSHSKQQLDPSLSPFETADPQFFWNASILASLLSMRSLELPPHHRASLDASHMLIQAIQGFAGVQPVNPRLNLSIVSRLSCRNAGTRFNARGIDDEGECGNFVETEFALEMPQSGFLASFIMVRGSVPVFWEQTGVQMTHRVEFSRGFEATALAFDRHFQNLRERYGDVHIVNLLSTKEGSAEQSLSRQYNGHVNEYSHGLVHYTAFDYHEYVKQSGHDRDVDAWGYTLVDTKTPTMAAPPLLSQQGVMRVNCLDCLDRTNHVQYILARAVAERCLREMEQAGVVGTESFSDAFQNLWADNGDWLSKIYTGTGALKSSLTRKGKQTFAGFLDDAAKSVNRFFINNFQDKRRRAIDLVLGKIRPHRSLLILNTVSSQVEQQLTSRRAEFAKMEEVTIFIGTWNVNGCLPGSEPLQFWIQSNAAFLPNLIVIGIQELIELKAQEIVTANTDSLCALWNDALMATLNGLSDTARYVPLRSVHLMALGLFVYVREDCVTKVRGVEVASCKTGFAGIAANKGGIGLSCLYQDTSMVFITAHFAAGEWNAEDRNEDYRIISNGLVFKRKSLAEHNMVFWLGDFNYRVAIPNDEARSIIDQGRYPELLAYDQLKYWQDRGSVFDHFTEGPIHFPPTYKYDNGTNIYDSSEKARCPSWTDRVLYRGKNLQLLEYTNVDSLLKSDHRPVRAIFQAQVINHGHLPTPANLGLPGGNY
ncbi:Endonuclease/exonuclease/phosphatase [Chytriomyces sp. MP71]|nr:Endonuclease/exonuclease/phosphatase [Chytriomyces sp. MP71]